MMSRERMPRQRHVPWTIVLLAMPLAVVNAAEDAALPLEKVVLFTSGVGFFQHGGGVTDDATVEMSFKTEQINDLLKSMVVEDLGGGTVASVGYASRDPLARTLETFAVDLTDEPSIGRLLGRLRGARIELEAAPPASGTIVGVEKRSVPAGDDGVVEREYITILTAEGLRTLPLDSILRVKLLDPRLQADLEKALAVLALGHDDGRKGVSIAFTGKGPRKVRVGYVQESPVWKTSYRLVLDDEAGKGRRTALLQGWAIVENTTDQDWKDVRMALVSGRPISFVMDLYQPLYLPRPEVRPDLLASLAPQLYGQDLANGAAEFEASDKKQADRMRAFAKSEMRRAMDAAGPPVAAAAPVPGERQEAAKASMREAAAAIRSVATAAAAGEFFRYEIEKPVSIPRQRSAMLPIVSDTVSVEKVAIYDDRVMQKHPLSGLRLVNSTKLDLMQGPITVYEADGYAGDARIEDMAAGSERLLSYAVDLDVEVAPRMEPMPEELVGVKIDRGTLVASRKLVRKKRFDVRNSGGEPVKLLVEHPIEPGWRLVAPQQPEETTRDRRRFAVVAEPGKPVAIEIVEEQLLDQRLVLTNVDDGMVLFYSNAKSTSPAVRAALEKVLGQKRELDRIRRERERREQEIGVVSQEQERIRQNMQQLDRTSDLYTRYVGKFAEQEDRVEKLRKEIASFTDEEQRARKSLDDLLASLDAR